MLPFRGSEVCFPPLPPPPPLPLPRSRPRPLPFSFPLLDVLPEDSESESCMMGVIFGLALADERGTEREETEAGELVTGKDLLL